MKRLLLALLAPCAFLALAEAVLVVADIAPAARVGVVFDDGPDGSFDVLVDEVRDGPDIRVNVPRKRPGTHRTVVIGDSTPFGLYLMPTSTIGKFLEFLLPTAIDGPHEVLTLAAPAIRAERSVELVRFALAKLEPDAIVVYCGHNEFLPRYITPLLQRLDHPMAARAVDLLSRLRLGRLLLRASAGVRSRSQVEPIPERIRAMSRADEVRPRVHQLFESQLFAIANACDEAGVALFLPTAISNGLEYPPLSAFSRQLCEADRDRFIELLDRARGDLRNDDVERAVEHLEQAAAIDPDVGELVFLRARVEWLRGHHEEARRPERVQPRHFNRAPAHRATRDTQNRRDPRRAGTRHGTAAASARNAAVPRLLSSHRLRAVPDGARDREGSGRPGFR